MRKMLLVLMIVAGCSSPGPVCDRYQAEEARIDVAMAAVRAILSGCDGETCAEARQTLRELRQVLQRLHELCGTRGVEFVAPEVRVRDEIERLEERVKSLEERSNG